MRQVFRRNARAGVSDGEPQASAVHARAEGDRSARWGVPQGVRHEILDRLLQAMRIPGALVGVRSHVHVQRHPEIARGLLVTAPTSISDAASSTRATTST